MARLELVSAKRPTSLSVKANAHLAVSKYWDGLSKGSRACGDSILRMLRRSTPSPVSLSGTNTVSAPLGHVPVSSLLGALWGRIARVAYDLEDPPLSRAGICYLQRYAPGLRRLTR